MISTTRLVAVALVGLLGVSSLSSYARSGGSGGAGGNAGGSSAGHMSSKGVSNTNSPISADRDKGLARAGDRASTHAQSHPSPHSNKGKHTAVKPAA
ncbi:hypothetical protein M0D69_34825 [Caballeronia sp. SEWSISQ10-4 2]|uniref:hypothetical protein n=1 Tax=Caballeronia sp. SEWSISQ10-4 2 TaxID=2937438 RepID=UPI0026541A16|nr:hypothetical protein [Caballeronia sp. SEWSISQ10-4 2]MDN7183098.1 hypothetical protein [Caballeronia sp. SEWSISQ10-4 2]